MPTRSGGSERARFGIATGVTAVLFVPTVSTDSATDGVARLLSSTHTLLAATVIGFALALVGIRVLRLLRLELTTSPALIPSAFFLGSAIVGWVLMTVGLIAFDRTTVRLLVVGLVVLAANDASLAAFLGSVETTGRHLKRTLSNLAALAVLVLGLPVVFLLLLLALGPTVGWDVAMYHLAAPSEFLANGSIYLPPDNLHVAYTATPHMLNVVGLAAGLPAVAVVLQWMNLVFIVLVVSVLADRVLGSVAAGVALAVPFAMGGLLLNAAQALTDTWLVLGILVLVYWAVVADDRDGIAFRLSIQHLALLSLLSASSLLIKYQAIPFIGAVVLVALAIELRAVRNPGVKGWLLGLLLAAVLLTPFLVKNTILLGSPFYPFTGQPVFPPWIAVEALGGDTSDLTGTAILGQAREPFSFTAWLMRPEDLGPELTAKWNGMPLMFLAAIGAFFLPNRRTALALLAIAGGGVVGVLAVSARTNPRYLFPGVVLVGLVASFALSSMIQRFDWPFRQVASILVIVAVLAPSVPLVTQELVPSRRALVALGLHSIESWATALANDDRPEPQLFLEVDQALSQAVQADGRVLLFFDARGFNYSVDVLQDNVHSNWKMLHEGLGSNCLDSEVATHLLWNGDVVAYFLNEGVPASAFLREEFNAFASRCLILLERVGGVEIYEVGRG